MADLTTNIEQLTKDIDGSKACVAEMMNQMKRASETREAEYADPFGAAARPTVG